MRRRLMLLASVFFALPAHAALEVNTTRLGHGVSVWYANNPRVPVVDVVLSFEGAGSASDPAGTLGRAAFAASLLNEGAGELDSVSFQRALQDKAITLEASAEADRLNVHVRCLREDALRAGELLAMALSKPQLAAADQQRMKTELLSLLRRQQESPGYQAQRQLLERAFAGHPYANPSLGNEQSLAVLDAEDVRDYLKTHVTRSNLLVAAAGDVDSSLLDQMLGPVVDALPENDTGAIEVAKVTPLGGGEQLNKTMAVPQTVVQFMAPWIPRDDKRYYAAYLLNYILGGDGMESRLSALRKKSGLVYGVGSTLEARRGVSVLVGSLATRNSTAEQAIAEVKQVLASLRDNGVSTEECADAKSYAIGSKLRELDASGTISATLLSMQIHALGEDYLGKRAELFRNVSCAEINALAKEYLKPERFLFSRVGGAAEAP